MSNPVLGGLLAIVFVLPFSIVIIAGVLLENLKGQGRPNPVVTVKITSVLTWVFAIGLWFALGMVGQERFDDNGYDNYWGFSVIVHLVSACALLAVVFQDYTKASSDD